MKKIHVLVLRSYLGPFVLTFVLAEFILLMQFLWKYIDDLVGKGLEWYVIGELLFYASATLVPMALPLAILLASIMTFGNMGEFYELTALKSAGISLRRIMAPLIILSIFISGVAFYFSNNMLPYANLKMYSLLWDVRQKKPELDIIEGIFNNDIEGYSIKIMEKDRDRNMMYNVLIYNHTDPQITTNITMADSGRMKLTEDESYLMLELFQGESYIEMQEDVRNIKDKTYPFRREKFEKETILMSLENMEFQRTDENLFKQKIEMKNVAQLQMGSDSLQEKYEERMKRFVSTMIIYNYFKRQPKPRTAQDSAEVNWADSSYALVDYHTMIQNIKTEEKKALFSLAHSYAVNAQTFIKSNVESLFQRKKLIYKHDIEFHKKFTLSIACLILFFIGAPFGAIIRKGGLGLPMVVSVLLFLTYYVISMIGEKSASEMAIEPSVGMWISSGLLLPLGIFLSYKASRDSNLFSMEWTYSLLRYIKKIARKKKS